MGVGSAWTAWIALMTGLDTPKRKRTQRTRVDVEAAREFEELPEEEHVDGVGTGRGSPSEESV